MVDLLAGVNMSTALLILNVLGLPGLIFMIWYVDQKRFVKSQADHREMVAELLKNYKEDVDKVTRYYERNVELVTRYEKLANDLSDIIHLNTQAQTRLVESIKGNQFCPAVRQAGPGGA
jgi:hypothetical protein